MIVESCADLSDLNIENTISITPNPSNGVFVVSYGLSQKKKVEFEIIDVSGKRIYKKKFQDGVGTNAHEISLKNISVHVIPFITYVQQLCFLNLSINTFIAFLHSIHNGIKLEISYF